MCDYGCAAACVGCAHMRRVVSGYVWGEGWASLREELLVPHARWMRACAPPGGECAAAGGAGGSWGRSR